MKPLLLLFLVLFCQPVRVVGQAKSPVKKPNILLILADDLGYGDLGSYGAPDIRTPHIDSLVRAGMRFSHFYANSSVCSPSRAALLSGRYPEQVGVPGVIRTMPDDNWGYLSPTSTLLPSVLKKNGYHTALIGKWHLGLESPNLPNDREFDLFHGFEGDMMDDYYTHLRHDRNYMRLNRQIINPQGHATDLFTQWATDYLGQRAGQSNPFFLYLAYNAPHDPIQPPADWLARVKARQPGISDKRAKLVGLIEHMDDGIGKVIQTLRAKGLYENTLIVFVSDNGGKLFDGANNGPLRSGKGHMYEGGIRIPACVVWPGKVAAQSQSQQPLLLMDIFPTLLEASGTSIGHSIDGQSFLSILRGEGQPPAAERPLFFIRREGGSEYNGKTIDAVRLGDWKLLQDSPYRPLELYNLKEDPLEKTNRASDRPEEFRRLEKLMREHTRQSGAIPWEKRNKDF
ncbi:sulfatase-like hydrolase/transferase [Spirosoma sp.]|uniref:sulfatase family protein n=1 Tax=Spirosoma sp. TaxID=1899569 RepID=UPI002617D3DB|nr:sulfatase-like hydrolase/transferase [Spirosoma sp.]MCX6214739.1 sulfatase-like hydrolase/transferase [Spirosoma sp.]